jgi:hypothetical protein
MIHQLALKQKPLQPQSCKAHSFDTFSKISLKTASTPLQHLPPL